MLYLHKRAIGSFFVLYHFGLEYEVGVGTTLSARSSTDRASDYGSEG